MRLAASALCSLLLLLLSLYSCCCAQTYREKTRFDRSVDKNDHAEVNKKQRVLTDHLTLFTAYKDAGQSICYLEKIQGNELNVANLWQDVIRGNKKTLYATNRALKKIEAWRLAGDRILDFCRGMSIYLLQENRPNLLLIEDPRHNTLLEERVNNVHKSPHKVRARRAAGPYKGRFRGQTQSQYLSIGGDGQKDGRAEAEATLQSTHAVVSGSSGMGQAQSMSSGSDACEGCSGYSSPEQTQGITGSQQGSPTGLYPFAVLGKGNETGILRPSITGDSNIKQQSSIANTLDMGGVRSSGMSTVNQANNQIPGQTLQYPDQHKTPLRGTQPEMQVVAGGQYPVRFSGGEVLPSQKGNVYFPQIPSSGTLEKTPVYTFSPVTYPGSQSVTGTPLYQSPSGSGTVLPALLPNGQMTSVEQQLPRNFEQIFPIQRVGERTSQTGGSTYSNMQNEKDKIQVPVHGNLPLNAQIGSTNGNVQNPFIPDGIRQEPTATIFIPNSRNQMNPENFFNPNAPIIRPGGGGQTTLPGYQTGYTLTQVPNYGNGALPSPAIYPSGTQLVNGHLVSTGVVPGVSGGFYNPGGPTGVQIPITSPYYPSTALGDQIFRGQAANTGQHFTANGQLLQYVPSTSQPAQTQGSGVFQPATTVFTGPNVPSSGAQSTATKTEPTMRGDISGSTMYTGGQANIGGGYPTIVSGAPYLSGSPDQTIYASLPHGVFPNSNTHQQYPVSGTVAIPGQIVGQHGINVPGTTGLAMGSGNQGLVNINSQQSGKLMTGDEDAESQAITSVKQGSGGTTASASAEGRYGQGSAKSQVSGTYNGGGSFSAQAGTSDNLKSAQTQVSGGKEGAKSSAQGSGGLGKSQTQVELDSASGATMTNAQSSGLNHGTNSQVQASGQGGLADAQANGEGQTSSQAQIGFQPFNKKNNKSVKQDTPFRGGGTASAQSGTYRGQTQSQLQGSFQQGVTYTGAAQANSGSGAIELRKPFNFSTPDQNLFKPYKLDDHPENSNTLDTAKERMQSSGSSRKTIIAISSKKDKQDQQLNNEEDYEDYEDEEYNESKTSSKTMSKQTTQPKQTMRVITDGEYDIKVNQREVVHSSEKSLPGYMLSHNKGEDLGKSADKLERPEAIDQNGGSHKALTDTKSLRADRDGGVVIDNVAGKQAEVPKSYVSVTNSVAGKINDIDTEKKYEHRYYTKSSACGYFSFSCNVVYGTHGARKICKPKMPAYEDGSAKCT